MSKMIAGIALVLAAVALVLAVIAMVSAADEDAPDAATATAIVKDEPAAYTKAFVDEAIRRYSTDGLDATVAYYNSPESVDGEWYVFITDENEVMLAHATVPENVGMQLRDIYGTDGYPAGRVVADAAAEGGAWTTYSYLNPAIGGTQSKHSWVVRHDGYIFGSGWYEPGPPKSDRPAYTVDFVDRAIELYEAIGFEKTVEYYSTQESVDGPWYMFIINPEGYTVGHPREEIRFRDPSERVDITGYFYGDDILGTDEEGRWVSYVFLNVATGTEQVKHSWVVKRDGYIFGSGWYERYIGTLPGQS